MPKGEVGTAVAEPRSQAVQREQNVTIADLVTLAKTGDLDVGVLERLVALQERATARNARDAFNEALAAFQDECPQIARTAGADFVNRKGGQTQYNYAPLDEVARVIRPILRRHGLSYTWDATVAGNMLTETCHVRHVEGHSESSSFTVPTETNAAMSPQQKYGAAATYAQRRSLISALGITTAEDDTDGAEIDPDPISADQEATLNALIREVRPNMPKFLEYFRIDTVVELPVSRYQEAVAMLEQKRGRSA